MRNGIRKGVDNLDAWCFLRSYRTPMGQASCQRLAQSSPPFSWEEIRLALMLDIGAN
jgi:hypothetical protein